MFFKIFIKPPFLSITFFPKTNKIMYKMEFYNNKRLIIKFLYDIYVVEVKRGIIDK